MNSNNQKIKNFELDIFKLHVTDEDIGPRSYIKVYGKNLFSQINVIINDILKRNDKITYLSKRIAKKLGCHTDTILKMLIGKSSGNWISLPVILELLNEWKIKCKKGEENINEMKQKLQSCFEKLGCGSKERNEVKTVKHLNVNLAKIAGAHMADGHLVKIKTFKGKGYSYNVIIIDEYKCNLEAFSRWIKGVFGINVKIEKAKSNAWMIVVRNKIVGRYLKIFFGFPVGIKTYYNLPKIIENSSKEIKRAFVVGLLSFDGCVETDKTISYGIANETLRNQIVDILKEFNLKTVSQKKSGFYHFKTAVLNKNDLKKWMNFFELNTEKWFKLKDMIEGFNVKVYSYSKAMSVLNKVYKNGMKTNIPKITSTLKELKVCDKYILANKLKVGVSTLYRYIHILESANILIRTENPDYINLSNFHNNHTRMILTKDFVNKLFKKLKQKGYLRKELALKLGVCKGSVNNWAQYRHNISISKLKKLLELADIELKDSDIIGFNRLVFTYNLNIEKWRVPYRPNSLGNNFIKAVDLKTKQVIGKEHQLKNRDVVEILTSK